MYDGTFVLSWIYHLFPCSIGLHKGSKLCITSFALVLDVTIDLEQSKVLWCMLDQAKARVIETLEELDDPYPTLLHSLMNGSGGKGFYS